MLSKITLAQRAHRERERNLIQSAVQLGQSLPGNSDHSGESRFSFGLIPNVRAKGKASVRVADILNRMQAEEPVNSSDVIMHHSAPFHATVQDIVHGHTI
ncbi:hypothetical protein RHMOL_Rhmol10G0274600 [Rhododendron molle]|uniref:Uncharacterized protein n=1 Tax=Rhododendron molle TaxID=49168 RepID=A0ACC0M7U8_RHOML|nr:hypothetical protein RHMOL_Rhmol10G0274600 [Rhododendron molle]